MLSFHLTAVSTKLRAFQAALVVKNPSVNAEDVRDVGVQCLGQEDPLEKEMATHSSILAWRIPWTEEPGRLQSIASESDITEVSKHACTHTAQTSGYILHSSRSKSGKHQNSGHSCPCIWVLSLTLLNSVISPYSPHPLLNSVQVPCNCLTLNSPLIPGTWNTPSPACSMTRAA